MITRAVLLACLLFPVISCDRSPTAVPDAVLGDFGGDGIVLTAKRSQVIAILGCSDARADAPLVPDRDGRFVLAATIRTLWTSTPAVLRGTIVDATINLEIVTIAPDTILRDQYIAVRDQPGNTSAICAL